MLLAVPKPLQPSSVSRDFSGHGVVPSQSHGRDSICGMGAKGSSHPGSCRAIAPSNTSLFICGSCSGADGSCFCFSLLNVVFSSVHSDSLLPGIFLFVGTVITVCHHGPSGRPCKAHLLITALLWDSILHLEKREVHSEPLPSIALSFEKVK